MCGAGFRDAADHRGRAGKELGLDGFAGSVKVTCDDHNGHHSAYMQQWDGTKMGVKSSDWIAPMKDKVRPMLGGGLQGVRVQGPGLAEALGALRQVELSFISLPACGGGWRGKASRVGF